LNKHLLTKENLNKLYTQCGFVYIKDIFGPHLVEKMAARKIRQNSRRTPPLDIYIKIRHTLFFKKLLFQIGWIIINVYFCAYEKTQNLDVNMDAEIVAMYYGIYHICGS